MIGLDTNVFVRYLVQDDVVQSNLANRLIEEAVAAEKILWICQITLCETIWVLKKCYKLSNNEISHILQEILLIPQIKIENESVIASAIKDFEMNNNVGFSDCLIGRQNAHNGCEITYTFDKAAAKRLSTLFGLLK